MQKYAESIMFPKGILDLSKIDVENITSEELKNILRQNAYSIYKQKEEEFGEEVMRELERRILLRTVDEKWMDHIDNMEQLKYGLGL